MAKAISKTAMILNVLLMLMTLLLIFSGAQSRVIERNEKPKSEAHCDTIYGLTEGDACYGVAQMFNLTYTEFFGFNKFNVNRSSVVVNAGRS